MKKYINKILIGALLMLPFAFTIQANAAVPNWNTTGTYVVGFEFESNTYSHDMNLVQAADGSLSGNGGYPAGAAHTYSWTIDSGMVSGSNINFTAHYTAPADAVTPLTTLQVMGTIGADGTMSGTWSDNYQGGYRAGSWSTSAGAGVRLGTMLAEDFGVVDYDTGLGQLRGYSAGFGLTGATFEDVQSLVVQLFSGTTLLQTNTATVKVGNEITGNQISSPFDVSGNFDYTTDGYWVNVRESQYGQSMPATRVVATATLANGKVVSAENTTLMGDPASIYPIVPPTPTDPDTKAQCKKGGWKMFTDHNFKNQGQCIKWVKKNN